MYSGVARRSPEAEDRHRRDYQAHSPTHSHPYSPIKGAPPQRPYKYSSRPPSSATMSVPSAISPQLGPPPSPKLNGSSHPSPMSAQGGTTASTRYDPLSEHREGSGSRKPSLSNTRSPTQVRHFTVTQLKPAQKTYANTQTITESRALTTVPYLPRNFKVASYHLPFTA